MLKGRRPAGVHVGRDGWLFWLGRTGGTVALYADTFRMRITLGRWARLIERRVTRAAALGCRYVQVVVPDKLSVYDDKFAAPLIDAALSPCLRLGRRLAGSTAAGTWLDLLAPMRAAKAESDLFFRTDTHWSYEGCLLGYRLLCRTLGLAPARHVEEAPRLPVQDFVMDLGRKLAPPLGERLAPAVFELRATQTEANALARWRHAQGFDDRPGFHVGTRIVLGRPDGAKLRIVLFGDSFSSERGYTLTVMLAETVAELHYVWSANIDWDYVAKVRPDVVVHEIAERFMHRAPTDRFSVDAFAESRVRAANRTAGRGLCDLLRRGVEGS